jgi:hypothetical protein
MEIMTYSDAETQTKRYLESLGFVVTRIPKRTIETPDLLVEFMDEKHLVEVKQRERDDAIEALLSSSVPGEEMLSYGYRNVFSGRIGQGVGQLDSWDDETVDFRVIWYALGGGWRQGLLLSQLLATVYGAVRVQATRQDNTSFETLCLYFGNSEFYRYKQLNALVAWGTDGLTFLVNDLSHTYETFRETRLYQLLDRESLETVEPYRLEKEGYCMLVHGSVDRGDTAAVARHLMQKYGLVHLQPFEFELFNRPLDGKPEGE